MSPGRVHSVNYMIIIIILVTQPTHISMQNMKTTLKI